MDKLTTMNLIEQLGGYEKASKFCDKEIKEGGYPYGLIDELLEYRRANNIFEVGDMVVYKSNEADAFVNKNSLFKVFELCGDNVVYVKGTNKYCDFLHIYNYLIEFRHATQQEIEAGHRL